MVKPKPLDLEGIIYELDKIKSVEMFCLLYNVFFDDTMKAG